MDPFLFAALLVVVFVLLALVGRTQIATGANAQVTNGSVILVLATLTGAVVLNLVGALGVW